MQRGTEQSGPRRVEEDRAWGFKLDKTNLSVNVWIVYDKFMFSLVLSILVVLLVVGCGEEVKESGVQDFEARNKNVLEEAKDDSSVPLAITCVACGEKVSKKTE